MQGTLGGVALVYMYTATDQGFAGVLPFNTHSVSSVTFIANSTLGVAGA